VGNEEDGRNTAFNALAGAFLGQLLDASGQPIVNPGLWGLTFGNGGSGGDPNLCISPPAFKTSRWAFWDRLPRAALPSRSP